MSRLIIEQLPRPGWFNMAADAVVAAGVAAGESPPVVRFYTWSPPTVSLGFHQPPNAVNLNVCRKLNWDVVRRPTGGRALLHKGDLCYSVAIPAETSNLNTLRNLYQQIALAIRDAVQAMGILTKDPTDLSRLPKSDVKLHAGLCLDSRVRGEVATDSGKFAAAAQRVFQGSILQHGSILIDSDPGEIAQVIHGDRRTIAAGLRARACSLEKAAGHTIAMNELIANLVNEFSQRLEMEFQQSAWTEEELTQIARLKGDWAIMSSDSNLDEVVSHVKQPA